MHVTYREKSLIDIEREMSSFPLTATLTGRTLSIAEIISVARRNAQVDFTKERQILTHIQESYETMMQNVRDGVPIYGANTGYGAQASHVLADGTSEERMSVARKISEGIIHTDDTVGPIFEKDITRAAMLIRINMLMQGVSAVKLDDLSIYQEMLNKQITPIVNMYGGVGASGDLAHNSRVLSAARHLPGVSVWNAQGEVLSADTALNNAKIKQLILDPKGGLGLVNGDNFSTSVASLLAYDTMQALLMAHVLGAMTVEVLKGTNRSFHPMLGEVRPHPGQQEVASLYRYLLEGSQLAYQEMKGHVRREKGVKVQDGYSLRGIAQYHGVNEQKLKEILEVITINANSVSDNPLWVSPDHVTVGETPWQWVSGANFIAMHMVDVMDSLRKIMTQIVKLNDRHMAKLVNPHENNGLPANLSDKEAVTQCTFKGIQVQAGMFDVYSSLLSIPVSTFFGVHEEGNQDITSHALTSGILGIENLRLVQYSLAQNLLAVSQAVDLRGGPKLLSPRTRPLYEFVRNQATYVTKERPLNSDIETVYRSIKSGHLMNHMRNTVFNSFSLHEK